MELFEIHEAIKSHTGYITGGNESAAAVAMIIDEFVRQNDYTVTFQFEQEAPNRRILTVYVNREFFAEFEAFSWHSAMDRLATMVIPIIQKETP